MLNLARRRFATSCGLVGLPNIGKSTLFNALTQTQEAEASNYPFCTIKANSAKVGVLDDNLRLLEKAANAERVVPAQIQVWDIAGLIRGASEGAGLGNRFLADVRNVSLIIQLVRCFEDESIIHVDDVFNLDPVDEMQQIQTELILSDIETCQKQMKKRGQSKEVALLWERLFNSLNDGINLRDLEYTKEELEVVDKLPLITAKPIVYVCNTDADRVVDENDLTKQFKEYMAENEPQSPVITLSAQLEFEAAEMKNDGATSDEQHEIF